MYFVSLFIYVIHQHVLSKCVGGGEMYCVTIVTLLDACFQAAFILKVQV